jgi:hypothetical protein
MLPADHDIACEKVSAYADRLDEQLTSLTNNVEAVLKESQSMAGVCAYSRVAALQSWRKRFSN